MAQCSFINTWSVSKNDSQNEMDSHIGEQLNKVDKKFILNSSHKFLGSFSGSGVVVSPADFVVNTWSRSSVWAVWAPDPDSVSSCEEVLFSRLGSQVLLFVYVWACVQSARHMLTAVTLWLMITWAM